MVRRKRYIRNGMGAYPYPGCRDLSSLYAPRRYLRPVRRLGYLGPKPSFPFALRRSLCFRHSNSLLFRRTSSNFSLCFFFFILFVSFFSGKGRVGIWFWGRWATLRQRLGEYAIGHSYCLFPRPPAHCQETIRKRYCPNASHTEAVLTFIYLVFLK